MKDFLAFKIKTVILTIVTVIIFSQLMLSSEIIYAQGVYDESVGSYSDLVSAIGRAPTDGTPYVIEITDDIIFTNFITINNGKNVIIESDASGPWKLIRNSGSASNLISSRHFLVNGSSATNLGTLTLTNIIVDGSGTHGGINVGHNDSSIVGGVLNLNEDAAVQNCSNTNAANGGGITAYNGGKIIINGGIITGNKKNMTNGGGGVYLYGNSTLTMNYGEISSNQALGSSTSNYPGGGISTYSGCTITINGGKINGNEATQNGGGINLGSSTLVITGGEISGNRVVTYSSCYGGGIYATSAATLSIANAKISDNEAKSYGGGVYAACDLIVTNSIISGNIVNSYGGGIYTSSTLTVSGSTISGNKANTLYGGGIYGVADSSININDSTIGGDSAADTNTAVNGGGIYTSGALTISGNSVVSGNKVTGNGGGIYGNTINCTINISNSTIGGDTEIKANTAVNGGGIYASGVLTVSDNSIICGNKATSYGGGIFGNVTGTTINIINSTVGGDTTAKANTAANGGGIYSSGVVNITGSFISGNTSTSSGGGIYGNGTGSSINIVNSTVGGDTAAKANTAVNGGGIFASGSLTISEDSIVCGNKSTNNGGGIYGNGTGSSINVINSTVGGYADAKANTAVNGGGIFAVGSLTISEGSIVSGNKATSNGGGIYLLATSNLELTGKSRITVNKAVNGGGLYTASTNYNNIVSDSSTIFNENRASAAYKPPANAETLYPNIKFETTSITTHPLNNFDINFSGLALEFTLTYDANGGTGSYTIINIDPDDSIPVMSLSDTGISHEEQYTFAGWNTEADGSGALYQIGDDITVLNDTVLYAQWIIISAPPQPSEPSNPSEPSGPPEPSEPSEPSGPSEPSEPSGPSNPSGPSEQPKTSDSNDLRLQINRLVISFSAVVLILGLIIKKKYHSH